MDDEMPVHEELKKPPRRPRPSEIAAKKAKAAAKKKKKVTKSKPKTKAKPKAKRPAVKKSKAKKSPPRMFARLDVRLSKSERAMVVAKAKKMKRTITSVVLDAIRKLK